jgi:hypothetical protein
MDGILLVSYIRKNTEEGMDLEPAIVRAELLPNFGAGRDQAAAV